MQATKRWVSMAEAGMLVGARLLGRPARAEAARRWCEGGFRGAALRYEVLGGVYVTRHEWLQEFVDALDRLRRGGRTVMRRSRLGVRSAASDAA